MGALAFIAQASGMLPVLFQTGQSIVSLLGSIKTVAASGNPTQADWDALHATEAALRARLNDTSRDVPVSPV